MSVICKISNVGKVRSCVSCGLTFFVLVLLLSCKQTREAGSVSIIWKNNKPIAISFSHVLASKTDSISVHVGAGDDANPSILGSIEKQADSLVFTPMIPFTRGLAYELFDGGKRIASFSIPKPKAEDAPRLMAIYPTQDTVPENLLKIYLQFSQPMQEGRSAEYVTLLKSNSETVKGAFLDLQPELWNEDRTQLTLWLDPGRIKRDLQPNKKLGAPMQKNQSYTIVISGEWKDIQGADFVKGYSKTFVTTIRDSLSPSPESWKITAPRAETASALQIDFHESLDQGLLNEAFTVINEKGVSVPGKWQFPNEETRALFIPNEKWPAGNYHLKIDTRLEDLASNNVNRPFDRDITKSEKPKKQQAFVHIDFRVKPL